MLSFHSAQRWDKVYKDFKGNRESVWQIQATPWLVQKIPFLKKEKVKTILDAACGDGRNLIPFAKANFKVTGIDWSQQALERAKNATKGVPNITLLQKPLEDLSQKNGFDAIICDYALVHFQQIKPIIENFHTSLKKNGILLIQLFSLKDPHFGHGKKIAKNTFVEKEIVSKFYSINDIYKELKKFEILCIDNIQYADPDHEVKDFPREGNHRHDSFYIIARKRQRQYKR